MKIQDKWKWAAMDEDGEWWVYVHRPRIVESFWSPFHVSSDDPREAVGEVMSMPDIPWEDSLHQIIDGEFVKYKEGCTISELMRKHEKLHLEVYKLGLQLREYVVGI